VDGRELQAWWYNPRNGEAKLAGKFKKEKIRIFNPPGLIVSAD
jgi:hypothetical protein